MRRRRPTPALEVAADPVLQAGAEADVAVTVDGDAPVTLFLRLLGWDMRRPQRFPLGERTGSGSLRVTLPRGLPPGCARMTEYAVYAEARPAGGRLIAAAAPVGLIGDEVWWPDDERGEVVAIGDELRGHADGPAEVGAELHVAGYAEPRFLPVAAVEGDYAVTIGPDVPPTLHDGEDLGISWVVREGGSRRRFAVTDPTGAAAERRPPLLTFLAQLARDPFAIGP